MLIIAIKHVFIDKTKSLINLVATMLQLTPSGISAKAMNQTGFNLEILDLVCRRALISPGDSD